MARGRSNELLAFMQTLDAELMCGICLECFETPIMLPCSHNFCRKCIHSVIESGRSFSFLSIGPPTSFNCPVCQMAINMNSHNIDNLPVNKPLESIISLYQRFSPVDIFDMAWNRDLSVDGLKKCPDHHQEMSRFCESCNVSLCKSCEKEDHRSRHRVTSVTELASTLQADIADTLTELKKKTLPYYERIEQLDVMLKNIDTEEENAKRYLIHSMDMVKCSIRAKQEELSDTLHTKMHDVAVPINEQLKRCKQYRTKIQEMMKKLSAIHKTKDVILRIKLMKDTILQLNIMLQDDFEQSTENTFPKCDLPEIKLDTSQVTETLTSLQWIEYDPRKQKMCTIATQTDFFPEEVDHDIGLTVNQQVPDNKERACAIGQQVDEKKSIDVTTQINGAEMLLVETSQGTRPKYKGEIKDTGREFETVTDEEIDSITHDMSLRKGQGSNKPSKSTGRRSFPFDSFSGNSPHLEVKRLSSSPSRNRRPEDVMNGSVRTPPKDGTSEALAKFVARRRTLSPFPSGNTRQRTSTSPLARSCVVKETRGDSSVVKETTMGTSKETRENISVVKEKREDSSKKSSSTGDGSVAMENNSSVVPPERALSPRNYSKEPISVKLDFETDV